MRLSFANYALPAVFFMTPPLPVPSCLWLTVFALSATAGEFVKNICVIFLKIEICRTFNRDNAGLMIDDGAELNIMTG